MSFDSLLSNLKNKVSYNLHQAVNDPNANEFVANQPESPPVTKKVESDDYFEISTTDDPNTFSSNRLFRKIGNQIIRMIKKGIYPCLVIILTMYVTNEMIVYSAPIRLIFFMFTFFICYYFVPFFILLLGYYLCKLGYGYYLNQLSDGPKTKVMPTIFALLPLTTTIPVSSLGAFFMYPFTYPKNDKDAKKLPIIMNNYMESLNKSFAYFDKIKNLPFVAEGMKRLEANIEHLHDIPQKPEPVSSVPSLPATIVSSIKPSSTITRNNTSSSISSSTSLPAIIESTITPSPVTVRNNAPSAELSAALSAEPSHNNNSKAPLTEPSRNNNSKMPLTEPSSTPAAALSAEPSRNNNSKTLSSEPEATPSLPATIKLAKQPNTPVSNK